MSKGSGRIERRIGQLFAATHDRALSVGEIAAYAFELTDGISPDRKQRLSATRAAHRLLRRAAEVTRAAEVSFERAIDETTARLGRPPGGKGRSRDRIFLVGKHFVAMDQAYYDALLTASCWPAYQQAIAVLKREEKRCEVLFASWTRFGWRATETKDRRIYFHPVDYPVRIWAVSIEPEGVSWADAEITRIDNTYVYCRYDGEPARLSREKLARSWTLYRNVYFTSARTGYAANSFDRMWREQYWRLVPPPALQMALRDAMRLLGVPEDFTPDDILAAFRRMAMQCHPDHGGTQEQFIELMKARDRLLTALGTKAAAPKMPEFAPKGARLRYRTWRPRDRSRLEHTRRLSG